MKRDRRRLRRYAASAPPHQVRWIGSAHRDCPDSALRPWHPSPVRASLRHVPLLVHAAVPKLRAVPANPVAPAKAGAQVLPFPAFRPATSSPRKNVIPAKAGIQVLDHP